ncbi:MAG: hypothetical protein AAGJ18_12505 [Bacteroidota bacterium]
MKAITNISLVAICMIFCLQIVTATDLTLTYKYEYTRAFALTLADMQHEPHTIQIKDNNDFVFLKDQVVGEISFGKMYNLENLPKGEYMLIIENGQKIIRQPILTNDRFLNIEVNQQKTIYKPVVVYKEDHLDVNMLHFGKSKVYFQIRTDQGEVVHNTSFRAHGSVNKRVKINDLPRGKYQLDIQTSDFNVTKNFEVGKAEVLFAGSF